MNDLISRAELFDELNRRGVPYNAEVNMVINGMPSAQPEIIRCKDCKHRYIENMTWHCPFGLMGGEDFFCGYGSLGSAEGRTDDSISD